MPQNKAIISPILVGRSAQLKVLTDLIQQVQAGEGQIGLISGEAGIGKTRLVAETKKVARQAGFSILEGYCFEPDRTFPYAPFIDILRTYSTQTLGETTGSPHHFPTELADLLPALEAPSEESNRDHTFEVKQEKHHLFQSITQWLTQWASKQPLFIVIEDLHWSDESSLEVLLYLARRLSMHSILLLITYRADESSPTLTHFLSEIDRSRLATEVDLSPLSLSDVDSMLQAIFNLTRPVRNEFLSAIYTGTEGNPFFIEEVLGSLISSGEIIDSDGSWDREPIHDLHIPRSLHDAVSRRVARLSAQAQHMLTLAAVAGRRFDFNLLLALTQSSEAVLLKWIKESIAAQLVIEESAEQFAFRHALTRQAVYTELLASERKRLHRTILETIERLSPESGDSQQMGASSNLALLAYHAYEAEVWEKALLYSERAGVRAQALFAPRDATEHFTRALDVARRISKPVPVSLCLRRGQAYELLGNFTDACADYEYALNTAHQAQDGITEWQSLIDLGFLWAGRDYEQAGKYFRSAAQLAHILNDPLLHARSLNRLGNWLVNVGKIEESIQVHRQALEIFETKKDESGAVETLDLLGMAMHMLGDTAASNTYSQQAIALFRAAGEKRGFVSNIAVLNTIVGFSETTFWIPRTPEDCQRDTREALALARQLDWSAGQAQTEWTAALALSAYGEFSKALAHAQEALRIAMAIEHRQWITAAFCTLGQVYTLLLHPDIALRNLNAGLPIAHELGSAYWVGNISCYLAHAHLAKNEPQQAEAALRAVIPPEQVPHSLAERRMLWAWGEVMLAESKPDKALQIAERLIALTPGTANHQPVPALLKLKADALMAARQLDQLEDILQEAKLGAKARQALPLLWQIHASSARFYQLLKRDGEVHRELAEGREVIQDLTAKIDAITLRESFSHSAMQELPIERPLTTRRLEKLQFGGLTAREREVASQIAQGKSNRQIADEFSLSERTVENHISNILSKLNFDSRVQIAAWVLEKDLLEHKT